MERLTWLVVAQCKVDRVVDSCGRWCSSRSWLPCCYMSIQFKAIIGICVLPGCAFLEPCSESVTTRLGAALDVACASLPGCVVWSSTSSKNGLGCLANCPWEAAPVRALLCSRWSSAICSDILLRPAISLVRCESPACGPGSTNNAGRKFVLVTSCSQCMLSVLPDCSLEWLLEDESSSS